MTPGPSPSHQSRLISPEPSVLSRQPRSSSRTTTTVRASRSSAWPSSTLEPGGWPGQVETTTSPLSFHPSGGIVTSTGSASAFSQIRNDESHCCSPRGPGERSGSPVRSIPTTDSASSAQSSPVISRPLGCSQVRSFRPPSIVGRPSNQCRCRSAGCSRRSRSAALVTSYTSSHASSERQSIHDTSLSCPYGLLLPPCVRPRSSPAVIIGTPFDRHSVTSRLPAARRRSATISLSSVSPSTPKFCERLVYDPSRLPSPLASLCLPS